MEFDREKGILFDKWCFASKVNDYASLRESILLEDFKKRIPDRVVLYLNEQKVTTLALAAVLSDEYVLTHNASFIASEKSHVNSVQQSKLKHLFQKRIMSVFIVINLDMSSLTVLP